jgi:hypothetical protein
VALALGAGCFAGCGSEEQDVAGESAKPPQDPGGYQTVSDVAAHAAIGKDMAAVRAALEEGDFEAAGTIWSQGANSKKDDGTMRTLAGFAEGQAIAGHVEDALAGSGSAVELDAAQRAQWVDKGMLAAVEAKVLAELDAALDKVRIGETDAAEGAPHNVDEAWAFYVAEGEGLHATAEKREADFGLDGRVSAPVIAALAEAQDAAAAGEFEALQAARERVRGAMNLVFALATTKYAREAIDDEVAGAEAIAFAWGLVGDLEDAELERIGRALEKPGFRNALLVRTTLNDSLEDLGLSGPVPTYSG